MPREVTSFSNALVKQARGLRDKKNRKREGLFLAEGLRILTEARESGTLPETLFFSDASHPLLKRLIDEVEGAGGEAIEASADILHKISGKDNPQTVLGVFRAFDTALDAIDRASAPLWIVAQSLRDPGNIGTILRTGDAVGAGGLILLDESADPEMARAIETLAAEQREALLLVVLEGMSYAEAATALGIPLGTLMSRLGRARAALRIATSGAEEPRLRTVK